VKISAKLGLRVAALAACLGLVACGDDYDHTDLTVVGSSYQAGAHEATLSHISMTEGSAMTVHLIVYNDDNEKMPTRFQVSDNTVINFIGGVDVDNYTILALQQGHSQLQIIADDEKVVTINVDVVPQPPPP
jgi:hypothetical protein